MLKKTRERVYTHVEGLHTRLSARVEIVQTRGKHGSTPKPTSGSQGKARPGKSKKPSKSDTPSPPAQSTASKSDTGSLKQAEQKALRAKPVRTYQFYSGRNGGLLAAGLTYQGIFALFAILWLTFSIAGFVIRGDKELLQGLQSGVNSFVPGLIGTGGGSAVSLSTLLQPTTLGWSAAIALFSALFTSVGFLATLRAAIRQLFGIEQLKSNFVTQKLKDLGIIIVLGLLIGLAAAASILTTIASPLIFQSIGLPKDGFIAHVLSGAIGLVITAAVDTVVVLGVIRNLSGIPRNAKKVARVSVVTGIVLALLQTLGSSLLGAPKDNPLFASFAVLFGILVYFYFVFQILLYSVSWLAVDAGYDDRAKAEAGTVEAQPIAPVARGAKPMKHRDQPQVGPSGASGISRSKR